MCYPLGEDYLTNHGKVESYLVHFGMFLPFHVLSLYFQSKDQQIHLSPTFSYHALQHVFVHCYVSLLYETDVQHNVP